MPEWFHSSTNWWEILKPLARQMRYEPTPAENALWDMLRNRQIEGAKFRRQHAIDRFIVDFICLEYHLIIEVDGEIHQYTQEEDAIRQGFLEAMNFRVLRFSNDDVLYHIVRVVQEIKDNLTPKSPLQSGEGT
jgi:very-short-patch-repair endonuclease